MIWSTWSIILFAVSESPREVPEHHKNYHFTGDRHHNQESHEITGGTDAPNNDNHEIVLETKDEKTWWYTACKENEFICDDGQCISEYDECNGETQCLDGSDEMYCSELNFYFVLIFFY